MTAALSAFSSDIPRNLSRNPPQGRASFWSHIQNLVQWLSGGLTPTTSALNQPLNATKSVAVRAFQTGVSAINHSKIQPEKPIFKTMPRRVAQNRVQALRVVRVMEAGQPSASSGRMVISGRMADVCAELDRLAAREALLH
jgi:hypothetical protein